MSEHPPPTAAARFALTARQRRLRWLTAVVVIVIVLMIVYAAHSPLFRPTHPEVLTPALKKAIKAKILFVGFYWIVCFLLVALLPLLAWLDVRETVRKVAVARRDYWREIAERSRRRSAEDHQPDTGDDASKSA